MFLSLFLISGGFLACAYSGEKPPPLAEHVPMLLKQGTWQRVTVDEYIKVQLKGVTAKYQAVSVPDG